MWEINQSHDEKHGPLGANYELKVRYQGIAKSNSSRAVFTYAQGHRQNNVYWAPSGALVAPLSIQKPSQNTKTELLSASDSRAHFSVLQDLW